MRPESSELDRTLTERLPDLLATAMALTGEAGAAARLTGEVIVRVSRRRDRVDPSDPGPGLRNVLVARYVAQRSAGGGSTRVAQDGLDGLTRLQRAALLLSVRNRLTFAEIAGVLDRPVGTVARAATEAQTRLDESPYAITAAFDRLAAAAPDPAAARIAAVQYRRRQAVRRRQTRLLGTAALLVAALVVALPTVILPRLFPVPVRAAGVWAYGYDVTVPADYHLSQRYVLRDQDNSYLVDEADPHNGCSIGVSAADPDPVVSPDSRSVKVLGRPGWYGASEAEGVRTLTWSYASKAAAVVSCNDRADVEPLLLELARGVRFQTVPLLLPLRLDQLPAGYEVYAVGTSSELTPGDLTEVSAVVLAPVGSGDLAEDTVSIIVPGDRPEGRNPHTVKVRGTDAVVETEEGRISLCLPASQSVACLSSFSAASGGQRSANDPDVRRLVTLAESLSFASDLGDRTTWFDARQALPG